MGELTQRTNLSRPAVSHHLKILKEANLIGYDQEGTKNYYYLDVLKSDIFRLKMLFDHIDELIKDSQESNENTINDEG
ncbi:ArsR/SmtB family transcription factor [Paenibacillus sp. B-A-8]|uniref:ArsR/SmtB family transcription factor n=1 Tax=Paenibacillus sp. B-A-8 TaxID=3400419 RepID=UPI003B017EC3